MAAPQFTSRERTDVYWRLFFLNHSFHFIVQCLDALAQNHVFNKTDLKEMRGLAQEVQLEINTLALNRFDSVEHYDFAQFGKVRIALEKRLKEPLPKRRKR